MAGKVTNDQVSAKTLNVNDFRKAVNYVNPKNKGYVRFVPDGKGGVKLAKVNNKIDLFLSLRTNIDAEKNKAMRDKVRLNEKHELLRIMTGAAFRDKNFFLEGFERLLSESGKAALV